ncbi:MAG: GtrA family protein [Defluviitaleaceae bacterium]|nr:GtrA family protein [Defluviitaleaceae bacterium]
MEIKQMTLFYKYREQLAYLFFGGVTTGVNWSVFTLLVHFGIPFEVSNVISWLTAVMVSFCTSKFLVFKSTTKGVSGVLKEAMTFMGGRFLTGVLELGLVPFLVHIGLDGFVFGTTGLDAKILVSVAVVIGNYLMSKFLIFKS